MERTRIGDLELPASRVGLGTWPMGGAQWDDLVREMMSFHLGAEALAFTESALRECVTDPVGSEFMAPPE